MPRESAIDASLAASCELVRMAERDRKVRITRARIFLEVGDLPAALKVVLDLLEER